MDRPLDLEELQKELQSGRPTQSVLLLPAGLLVIEHSSSLLSYEVRHHTPWWK